LSRKIDVRVEDLLACAFTAALAVFAFGAFRSAPTSLGLDETYWWDFSFILAPVSILVFTSAVQFAWGGDAADRPSTLASVSGTIRDWLPFLVLLLTYETFRTGIWKVILVKDLDAELLRLDRRLFGETPAVLLERFVTPGLSNAMAAFYFLHLVLPPVLAMLLYRRRRTLFREFLLAVLLAGCLGSVGYVLVPATGPVVAFPSLFAVPLSGGLYGPVTGILDLARAPRDAFPSLHVGISTLVLWYGFRRSRATGLALLPLALGNWVSTLYLRYHYLVDVFAGWLTAALAAALAGLLLGLETRWKSRLERGAVER
jgi:membrane-associated phospholipid phosphatase